MAKIYQNINLQSPALRVEQHRADAQLQVLHRFQTAVLVLRLTSGVNHQRLLLVHALQFKEKRVACRRLLGTARRGDQSPCDMCAFRS